MKTLNAKIAIAFSALVIGFAVLWATGVVHIFSFPSTKSAPRTTQPSAGERSGKVLIHFKEFEYGKDWAADFEITNGTTQPVSYVGSNNKDRFTYCTLGVKHKEQYENLSFKVRDPCIYGAVVSLQTLEPGQSSSCR